MPNPNSSCRAGSRPTSASIGKPKVHWNGRKPARRCAHEGGRESGTSRPESTNSAAKYNSKMALTRVVQKVIKPSTHRSTERTRYAPQIATANTATSSGRVESQ